MSRRKTKLASGVVTAREIEETTVRLVGRRPGKTICPSEVARALAPEDFRALMPKIRAVAKRLVERGDLIATQRGKAVDPVGARGPIRLARAAKVPKAEKRSSYHGVDFREHPEAYRVGRGEQGVLSAEPYKSELLPLWRFRTPALARESAAALYAAFVDYGRARDFVGMDMARKFLQMGFTRSRRYANHSSGRKYGPDGAVLARAPNEEKAIAATHFAAALARAERHPAYRRWRERQKQRR